MNITCFSINCPERTGGKCWFSAPVSVKDKMLIMKEIKDFLDKPDYELSPEFEKLFNENKDLIYNEISMT